MFDKVADHRTMLIEGPVQPALAGLDHMPSRSQLDARRLSRFLTIQLFCLVFLQKIALPVPGIPPVSLPLVVLLLSICHLALKSQLRLSVPRLVIFGLFGASALVSQVMVERAFSLPSLLLLLIVSGFFVVNWTVDWNFYRSFLKTYQKFMLVPALMVFIQLVWQQVMHHPLGMDQFIPRPLFYPGYIYEAPMHFGWTFVRPNGFFMLEPSFVSALLAVAILTEIMYFRRLMHLLIFIGALVGCLAGTGFVMLAFAAPFVIWKQSPRTVAGCVLALLVVAPVALQLGAGDFLFGRVSEIDNPTQSGGDRLTVPARELGNLLLDPSHLVTGLGAGSTTETSGNAWPAVKLINEYGLIATTFYMLLFFVSIAPGANLPLKVAMAVTFHLTGGYLLNVAFVEMIVLFWTMLTPVDDKTLDQRIVVDIQETHGQVVLA